MRDMILAAPIGVDDAGENVAVDVATHGVIVADLDSGFCPPSNTGAFLRQLLAGAAAAADPSELQMWIVRPGYGPTRPDLRIAGAAPITRPDERRAIELDELERNNAIHALPHVAHVVSGACTNVRDRFVSLVTTEMTRRGWLLSVAQVPDVLSYNEKRRWEPALAPIPRIIVHIDNVHGLIDDRWPDDPGRRVLCKIARTGRALGIHLQLAAAEFDRTTKTLAPLLNYRVLLATEHRPWWPSGEGIGWIQQAGTGLLAIGSEVTQFRFDAPPQ